MFSTKYLGCETIESTWKSKRSTNTVATETEKLQSQEQSSQSKDKDDQETQTENYSNQPIIFAPLDEASVAAFLRKVSPGVLRELEKNERSHAFDNYSSNIDGETEIISKLHTLYYTPFLENKLNCTSLSWNSTGSLIAAVFGKVDHEDWCDHRGGLCVWNIFHRQFKNDQPKTVFEYSCCLTCLRFHPEEPSVIVGGSFLGELLLWDLSLDDKLVTTTPTGELGHNEPVTCIEWVKDSNSKSHKNLLVSCSLDGKILVWKQQTRNNSLELIKAFIILADNLPRSLRLPNKVLTTEIGISSLSFNADDPDIFVVGSESGGVFQCAFSSETPARISASMEFSKPLKNPVTLSYEPHKGQVHNVQFSPFSRNIFMTGSSDGELRLYALHQNVKPILSLAEHELLCAAKWSPFRPLLFVGITTLGQLNVYDFRINRASRIHSVNLSETPEPAWKLEMNLKEPKFIATSTSDGNIQIWTLSDQLISAVPHETEILQQMVKINSE